MTTPTHQPGSVEVYAYREGEGLRVMLLGSEMVPLTEFTQPDMTRLMMLSAAAAHASASARSRAAAAHALNKLLYPGEIGRFLRESPSCELTLRMSPDLDGLAWEHAGEAIGQKFRIARRFISPDGRTAEAAPMDPDLEAPLSVSLIDARPLLPDIPVERPPLAPTSMVATPQVVRAIGGPLAFALARRTLPPRRCLVVGEAGDQGKRIDAARAVIGQGHLLLDFGPVSAMAAQDDLVAALCEHLEAGHSVFEAVRRMRGLAWTARRGARSLVLYARSDCVFAPPTVGCLTGRDRRQVTTLSWDVVNSTGLLQEIGEREYSRLNSELHARCREIVSRRRGTPRAAQGNDGCMNYFGYPEAMEDAADQAVYAAREIAALNIHDRIKLRVGVATGTVASRWGVLYGLSLHLAAHLQTRAMENSVLVAESTQALTVQRFDLQPLLQKLHLKNIRAAQQAWLVLGTKRERALELPGLSPFVGRNAELDTLIALWDAAAAGEARSALIVGDAGIGKSRLLLEFRRRVQMRGAAVLQLRCTHEDNASAFRPLVDALRDAIDPHADDSGPIALSKLPLGSAAHALDTCDIALLARLVGMSYDSPVELASAAPERVRLRTLGALVRWFVASSRERPLCLLVEDIHWIDRSTAQFVDDLLAASGQHSLLTVLTRRHRMPGQVDADISDGWLPTTVNVRFDLQPLSSTAALALVGGLCHARMNAASVRLLVSRCEGVPLFLEEAARMALALRSPSEEVLRNQVPDTLVNLLTAQLDSLGPARVVMLLGSVLGREFSAALLRAVVALGGFDVLAQELDAWLAAAERSGLLRSSGDDEQRRYVFKHALIRDAASELLWAEDRTAVHDAVVKALRGPARDLAAQQPELLAVHLAGSGRRLQALEQWLAAARSASARSAKHEQASHLRSALALVNSRVIRSRRLRLAQRLSLQRRLASCYIAIEGYGAELVEKAYLAAADLSRELDDQKSLLACELGLEGCYFMRANFPLAIEFAQRAEASADRLRDSHHRLQAQWAIANIRFHQGDGLEAVRLMDKCLDDYEAERQPFTEAQMRLHPGKPRRRGDASQDPAVMCWCYSGWGQWELGYPDNALYRVRRAHALALALEHPFSVAEAKAFAINVHHYRGETRLALACANDCVVLCEEHGYPVWKAHALVMRGRLLCEKGRVADGLGQMAEGNALWVGTKAMVTRPLYLAMHAEGLALDGKPEQGLALLQEAMALVKGNGERYYEAELHRLTARLTLASAARRREPSASVQEEAECSLATGLALARAQHKRGFELRSATDLARLWGGRGEVARARRLLKAMLDDWKEGLQTHDVRAARKILAGMPVEQAQEEEHAQ